MERLNPSGLLTLDFADLTGCADTVAAFAAKTPIDAVVGVDERTAVAAAAIAARLGLAHDTVEAVAAAGNKALMRRRLAEAGVPTPSHRLFSTAADPRAASREVSYPCVLKPTFLAASRGVIRADDPAQFLEAWRRIAAYPGRSGGGRARRRCGRGNPRRRLRSRRRGRAGRTPDPRGAARARAFRQARPSERPLLRRNHLRDALAPRRRRPGGVRGRGEGGGARAGTAGGADPCRDPRGRFPRLRHRDCGALDRRPLFADAAVRYGDEPRGADPAPCARPGDPRRRARYGGRGRHDDPDSRGRSSCRRSGASTRRAEFRESKK